MMKIPSGNVPTDAWMLLLLIQPIRPELSTSDRISLALAHQETVPLQLLLTNTISPMKKLVKDIVMTM